MSLALLLGLAAAYTLSTILAGPSLVAAVVASLTGAGLVIGHHVQQVLRGR